MNIRSDEQIDREIKRVTDSYRRLITSQQSSLAVAYVSEESFSSDGTSDIMTKNLPIGTALFTALPAPAVPEALERMRAIVSDPRGLPRRKEWISGQQYSYVLLENVEAMVDEACRAAMLAQPVIPVEPTTAMQAAGAAVIRFNTTPINKLFTANAVYRAMLAAAPEAP